VSRASRMRPVVKCSLAEGWNILILSWLKRFLQRRRHSGTRHASRSQQAPSHGVNVRPSGRLPSSLIIIIIITFAKKDNFYVVVVVCLSVCLSVCEKLCAKTYERICMKFSGKVGNRPILMLMSMSIEIFSVAQIVKLLQSPRKRVRWKQKCHNKIRGKDLRKRNILSRWRKTGKEGDDWTSNGKEYQRTDAATGNERRPTVDRRHGGTCN